ncbi:MAG: glycosyltransferase [Anaerolineales bacterium]|jgi:polysaccharide pyruvyl transferase CsaB
MSNTTVVIAGYYGFKNTGDEVILAAIIQDLQSIKPDIDIIVLSGDPRNTSHIHKVKAIAWSDLEKIINAVKLCDFVILGGGGLFHDYWGFDPAAVLTPDASGIAFYGGIALLASILNKHLVLYAVGVGPLLSEMGKVYTQAIFEQAGFVTVRDEESKHLLTSMGITPQRIHVTADPSFGFDIDVSSQKKMQLKGKPILGVTIRNWNVSVLPDFWEQQVAGALDIFLYTHRSGSVVFFPFQYMQEELLDDVAVSERIQRLMKNSPRTRIFKRNYSIERKLAQLKQCDLILGMRLHAVILAIKYGIPVIGLGYDPKIKNVLSQAGISEYGIELGQLTAQNLGLLLERVCEHKSGLENHLQYVSMKLRKKAQENKKLVNEHIIINAENIPVLQPAMEAFLKQTSLSLSQTLIETRNQNKDLTIDLTEKAKQINTLQQKIIETNEQSQKALSELQNRIEIQTAQHKNEIDSLQKEYLQKIERRDLHINELDKTMGKMTTEHKKEISTLETQLIEKNDAFQSAHLELDSIKKSRGWKLLWALWQIRLFFVPNESRREKLLRSIWQEAKNLCNYPFKYFLGKGKSIEQIIWGRTSRYAVAFKLFTKKRNESYSDLSQLIVPSKKGLVSIVLPVYNGAVYLRDALDSILNQSYKEIEVIAVNDGSTDSSGEILEEYAGQDNRIHVIHQENQKLPRSLTKGFEVARGEFLTWTSHDNRLKKDYVEKMVACLQRHPSWDMAYANIDIIGEDGTPLENSSWFAGYQHPPGSSHIHLPKHTSELNTYPNNSISGAFLYRDRVKWLIGDYSPWQYTREDYDYWMKINALLKVNHVDFTAPVYDYRFHTDSLTHKDDELGITRDRKYLMVFEDFRRDFYLMPLLWFVEGGGGAAETGEMKPLLALISHAGNLHIESNQYDTALFPRLWIPCVYVKFSNDSHTPISSPVRLPPNTFKVLLSTSNGPLPQEVKGKWDMCLSLGQVVAPPKLDGNCQGWFVSQDMRSIFTAVDIRARTRHLELIEREIAQPSSAKYKVSAIICTYNREKGLEDTLHSITNQTMSFEDYEIIVVDNNADCSRTELLIEKILLERCKDYPDHIRLVHCPILGLSPARNAGISEAKGEILLFLDDDAAAEEDLLSHYWDAFSNHANAGVVGGHIILDKPENLSIPWKEGWGRYWSEFITGCTDFTIVEKHWEFPWGANWCARRKALLQIGGFRTSYGRRGNDFSGGEEIVAASLIQRLGYDVAVLPQARVIHHIDENRFTLDHLKQTIKAGLFVQYRAQVELRLPFEMNFRHNMSQIIKVIGRLFSNILHPRDEARKAGLLESYFYITARLHLLFRRQIPDGVRRILNT